MLLEGIFAAVTTCFYPDGRPYWRKLEQNIDRYSRTPLSGMVLLGSTGEAIMLSEEETRENIPPVLKNPLEDGAPHTFDVGPISFDGAAPTATSQVATYRLLTHSPWTKAGRPDRHPRGAQGLGDGRSTPRQEVSAYWLPNS